jgi:hypothetical protein
MTPYDVGVDTLVRWKTHPASFVRENFDVEPDEWQLDVLEAFPHHQRVAALGPKGDGKSTVDAWCGLNFLATRPHANVAVTSISGDNLKDGLWKEFAKWIGRSPFLQSTFEWQKERIVSRTHPATWWISARQWAKSADASQQADALAGLHSDFMLFIIDEAGAIPLPVLVTAEAALSTGIECKLLISGNTNTLGGPLHRAATTDRHLWYVVRVTGDPDDPKRSLRVDIEWARQQIAQWGRENAWVRCNVLAEFPLASLNALLGVEEVEAAMKRQLEPHAYEFQQKRIGVDTARFGDDRTVLAPRQGLQWSRPVIMRHARESQPSTDIAARVLQGKARWGSELEIFDGTGGWSAGAVDVMRAAGHTPVTVQFHSPATDPRFANRRAEMWWAMCEAIKQGAALPNIPELVGELTAPTYTFVNGKFQLEGKDQVKARIGRSPDLADAYALTFALPDMPSMDAPAILGMGGTRKAVIDYDPFAPDQAAERKRAARAEGYYR